MAEKNKLSPVMQQYVDMKSENPDALLLFAGTGPNKEMLEAKIKEYIKT